MEDAFSATCYFGLGFFIVFWPLGLYEPLVLVLFYRLSMNFILNKRI